MKYNSEKIVDKAENIFSSDISNQEIEYIRAHVASDEFPEWLAGNYTHIKVYHGARPTDVKSYYDNGFIVLDAQEQVEFARRLFDENNFFYSEQRLQEVVDQVRNTGEGVIHFLLYRDDLISDAPHYLIYGSEFLHALVVNIDDNAREALCKRGIPTIFHCHIPICRIKRSVLKQLHDTITDNYTHKELFSNFTIIVNGNVGAEYIVKHEHPIFEVYDYHASTFFKNTETRCSFC